MKGASDALTALVEARRGGRSCVMVTVVGTKGSIPRRVGAKMLVYEDGGIVETIGGGKFESLVVETALECLARKQPETKTFPLHESHEESFGAICGGEVTVFIEPFPPRASMVIVGAGHCGQAIARLATELGYSVMVIDDREELWTTDVPHAKELGDQLETLGESDAVVLVSRNWAIDTRALAKAVRCKAGYLGMIGSRKKVRQVFETLREEGVPAQKLNEVFTPIGLDIGSDTPAEIAVSVMAEVLLIRTGRKGGHQRRPEK